MLQLASTTKRMRLADRRTRTFSRKSCFFRAKANSDRSRRFWKGAAARKVASKARSVTLSFLGRRARIYRPRLRSVLVWERRPACLRVSRSSWVSRRRALNSCLDWIFWPPSHQCPSWGAWGMVCGPASVWATSAPSLCSESNAFFLPIRHPWPLQRFRRFRRPPSHSGLPGAALPTRKR